MNMETEKEIEKLLERIYLIKLYYNRFTTLRSEALVDKVEIFYGVNNQIQTIYEKELKELRFELCKLRGE